MIKAIFWDNDGVLVDTEKLYYRANKAIFSNIGIILTEEMYIENFLNRSHGTWHLALGKGLKDDEINQLRKERNKLYAELIKAEMKVINGAEETLKELYGKFLMGIVTSSRRDHFEIIHSRTNLLKYFDFTLTSDDFRFPKPDPEPYLKALETSGLKSEECIVVEDSHRGLVSALKAGLKCYIIPTKLTEKSNFDGAEKIILSVSDLPQELLI